MFMLLHLDLVYEQAKKKGRLHSLAGLHEAVVQGALARSGAGRSHGRRSRGMPNCKRRPFFLRHSASARLTPPPASVGGASAEVLYSGPQGAPGGAGSGECSRPRRLDRSRRAGTELTVEGKQTNTVTFSVM